MYCKKDIKFYLIKPSHTNDLRRPSFNSIDSTHKEKNVPIYFVLYTATTTTKRVFKESRIFIGGTDSKNTTQNFFVSFILFDYYMKNYNETKHLFFVVESRRYSLEMQEIFFYSLQLAVSIFNLSQQKLNKIIYNFRICCYLVVVVLIIPEYCK